MEYWIIWLLIVFFLSFIEVITVNLITIWFIASAIIALFVSLFVNNFTIQFAVFGVVGIILLLTTKKTLKKVFDQEKTRTNADRVIGMIGIVTEEISKNVIGEVKVDGKKWSAISSKKIPINSEVIIEKIEGVKLIVSPIAKELVAEEKKLATNKRKGK